MPTRMGEGRQQRDSSPASSEPRSGEERRARLLLERQASSPSASEDWRRERDSNPRYGFPYTRFPSVRLKPLGHLSVEWVQQFTGRRRPRQQQTVTSRPPDHRRSLADP